ncbi:transmembrane protein 107 isoform X2 [Alligator mississippiensis]|uniref:transmembrane protein 107 isoform X2 n=1 Tax=Alligator mississippiensis TaxID=8496 RepID=UPI002877DD28|nr:transmembrane protein 107 isoform X2 [Alligator mississippiensis]
MAAAAALVPWRFLALVAHLVIVIGAFWAREDNVRASLPLDHTPEEYGRRDTELVVALSVTLGLFAVELAGFLSGVSMFNPLQGLLSLGAHCGAAISLSLFLSAHWESASYWYILGTCSALPAAGEILLFVSVFGLKKKPL